jgi:hypothetical protein
MLLTGVRDFVGPVVDKNRIFDDKIVSLREHALAPEL